MDLDPQQIQATGQPLAQSCPLPKKKSLSIAGRIWLSFSILVLGYTVLMLQGAWVGKFTQEKNHLISNHLFPAALQAQNILTAFKEQSRLFEEAILSGENEQLQQASKKSLFITEQLSELISDKQLPAAITSQARRNRDSYQLFIAEALPTYTRMLTFAPDEEMRRQAAATGLAAQQLLANLVNLENNLAAEMKQQLQTINSQSQRHKIISIVVFISAVALSILLVWFILSRFILSPLQETVQMANLLASGSLSHELPIHHHDEIGELTKAMNIMAGELEVLYSDMDSKVKERTASLEQTNKQMELEVERRQRTQKELVKALEAAKGSDKAKSSFLANMSHEIRTPMNGIIGMASLLTGTEMSGVQQRYIATIKNSAESLLQIINDILDFSKVEAGKLELDTTDFNLHETIAFVTEIFTNQAREKDINLFTLMDSAVPATIHGDEGRLRQVLLNLVGNAIKFTQAGEIAIRIKVEQHEKDHFTIRFSVSDTGIGIAREQLVNLFQPFTQADVSTTRKFGGTGLGLSICHRLVELMSGEINAESKENEGSTFWFTAQFSQPTAEVAGQISTAAQGGLIYSEQSNIPTGGQQDKMAPDPRLLGKKILITDDDTTNIIVTEAILEALGCETASVSNGQEAVQAVRHDDFDLVLMDSQMPVMGGVEATEAIRRLRDSNTPQLIKRSKLPVVALTADAIAGAKEHYLQAGMDDYLSKPIRPETMQRCLLRWLAPGQDKPAITFPRQRLLKRLGNDEEKLNKLLSQAREEIPDHLAKIKNAFINNSYEDLAPTCQALKVLGAELGIASMQHQALHCHLAAEDKKCDPGQLQELSTTLEQVARLLEE